jgi:hypothetical protein
VQAVLYKLLGPFSGSLPGYTVLCELFHGGSQLGFVKREIVHAAYAQDTHTRESGANTIHERAASGTEVVGHGVVLAGGLVENSARLTEGFQVLAAAKVPEVGIEDSEIGCVHRRGKFVAVGAVADEGAYKTRALDWLW